MLPRIINLPKNQSFFLFGARQTGKSTLVNGWLTGFDSTKFNLLESDTFLELSRDPSALAAVVEQELEVRKSSELHYVFIDEIQRIPELLNVVQILIDRHNNLRVVLTGSSARKLRRVGVNLGGARLVNCSLFPLTWSELDGRLNLELALKFGTLPPVFNDLAQDNFSADAQAAAIRRLRAYLTIYLEEEIRNEGLVRSLGDFSRFLQIAAQNNGGLVNYSNISRESQVARKTVEGYYQILLDTLIAHRLEPFESSARKQAAQQPKFYLFDTGLVNAINGSLTAPLAPDARGNLFETLCICEAFRLRAYLESEAKLHFWRTRDGAEVDLLVENHGKLLAAFEFKSGKQPHLKRKQLGNLLEQFPGLPIYLVTEEKEQKLQDSGGNFYGDMIPFTRYLKLLERLLSPGETTGGGTT